MGRLQKTRIAKNRIGHALNRLKERFSIYLNEYEYFCLVEKIILGQSIFVCKLSNRYSLHKVQIGSEMVPCVYSSKNKIIVTVYLNKWIGKDSSGKFFVRPREKKIKKKKRLRFIEKPHFELKNKWSKKKKERLGLS